MAYEVKTAVFEGPFDLLLQLITRHQLDITNVSLVDIVTEYLAHLDAMREMDLEVTSEFLLIAATLIHLKARHLLPDERDLDLDGDLALLEERDRLLARLLACVTFKDVAAVLAHRMGEARRLVPRRTGIDQEIAAPIPEFRIEIGPLEFAKLAARVLTPPTDEPDVDHLDLDLPSVDDAISDLRVRIGQEVESTFDELVEHCTRRVDVVAYFLAMLELARWGAIEVAQPDWFSAIQIRLAQNDIGHVTSEWTST
jgi:segregation and condensation protein A